MAGVDADLRSLFNGQLHVRRPSLSRSGSSETLGVVETFEAYVEPRSMYVTGPEPRRVTVHFCTVDADDVAASPLGALRVTDRYWINDEDPADVSLGKKPSSFEGPLKDPENPGVDSHYEVTL